MSDLSNLKQQKATLLKGDKPPRAREAAKKLNISEAEYASLSCGETVHALNTERLLDLINQLHRIGEVMALTRNDVIVLEHHGIYNHPVSKHGYVIINEPDMDLRLKVSDWQYAFAVDEGGRQSFQFFDQHGQAAHKIYMTKHSNLQVYDELVSQFIIDNELEAISIPKELIASSLAISSSTPKVDKKAFQQEWLALDNPHHIDSLFQSYDLTRPQAYRYLEGAATLLKKNALQPLLEKSAENNWSLLMFVPNASATQIHNGVVHKLLTMGPWFNVLDPKFNMHANLQLVAETWLVEKQTNGESVLSLELFDANDKAVMMVYLHPSSRTKVLSQQWKDFLFSQKLEGIN